MALSRKYLKTMGLTDEQVDTIIELHAETVNGLKAERDQYKAEADKLPDVQKELDDLKGDGTNWKTKYEAEHTAFDSYKKQVETEQVNAGKIKAAEAALEAAGVKQSSFRSLLMKQVDLDKLELEGDGLKDADNFVAPLKTAFPECFGTTQSGGLPPTNPPSGGAAMSKEAFEKLTLDEQMAYANEHAAEYAAMYAK